MSRLRLGLRLVVVAALVAAVFAPWTGSTPVAYADSGRTSVLGVAGTAGEVLLERRGSWGELQLPSQSANVDVRLNVETDKTATGRGQTVVVIARRSGRATEYRARLRFEPTGAVTVTIVKLVRGTRQVISPTVTVPSLVHRPGVPIGLRVRVRGADPVNVAVKAWRLGGGEPSRWTLAANDSTRELTSAGWLGLGFGVSMSSTNAPVVYAYDRVTVDGAPVPAPTDPPTPLPMTSPTPTTPPTPTPTPSPTATPTPTPTATATPTPTPIPTPSPTPTPTPTPTPSDSPPPNAFYVSPTGNDGDAGTAAAPWRTLQKAADTVSAGATVSVRDGHLRRLHDASIGQRGRAHHVRRISR